MYIEPVSYATAMLRGVGLNAPDLGAGKYFVRVAQYSLYTLKVQAQ